MEAANSSEITVTDLNLRAIVSQKILVFIHKAVKSSNYASVNYSMLVLQDCLFVFLPLQPHYGCIFTAR
jgi:hypothetical protein